MTYYTVQINSGNSPGPYNIYYNTVNSGTITLLYPSGLQATNLTLIQLQNGVVVYSPNDDIGTIIVENIQCKTSQNITVPTTTTTIIPCFCVSIISETNYFFEFCYNGNTINGKPQYQTTSGVILQWQNIGTGYWEILDFSPQGVIFRSIDADNIPDTNWFGVGTNSSNYTILANIGECVEINPSVLEVTTQDPGCFTGNDGSIFATAQGGTGGWSYSLDGIVYTNYTGIFNNLTPGQYTVYAKDSSGNVISQTVTIFNNLGSIFSIPATVSVTQLPPVYGNFTYYNVAITYNTTSIPVGETITFDYEIFYETKYFGPGQVSFDTTQHFVVKNGINQTINSTSSQLITQIGPGTLGCIPFGEFSGNEVYTSPNITLTNTDTFTANIVYGIDTRTNGTIVGSCVTNGEVNINISFENVTLSCDCCTYAPRTVRVSEPPQFYNG